MLTYAPHLCPGPNGDWRDDGRYSMTGYHHADAEPPSMGTTGTCYYCQQTCTVERWNDKVYWVANAPIIEEEPI